jgi:nucleoside-diphosphate-sugar epimerase
MKVLLTGATGFVGSHILDALLERGMPTAVLLRRTSNQRFIEQHLQQVEVHHGSITEPNSIRVAMEQVTHVIHCAGRTKAVNAAEFFEANHQGTRQVVEEVNHRRGQIQRLVHVSSLAAAHPAVASAPAREDDPSNPVSEYGKSKLAGENEVRETCQTEFVILRPSAVYGPRDADFLKLFKAVKARVLPSFGGGRQALSLVFAKDLAQAAVECLTHPRAAGKILNVASPEIITARELSLEIARQMQNSTIPLPLPLSFLWPICLAQELISRITGQPGILSRQKYRELRAPGWVCDTARIREEIGFVASTSLEYGIRNTLQWYRQQRWL